MKNTIRTFLIAFTVMALAAGCIKEIEPQTNYVTEGQSSSAPGSFANFVSSITNTLCGQFTYAGADDRYPWDYGYPSFFLQRDVMGQDIVQEDGNDWYSTWYGCGNGLGPRYMICQIPWTYYYGWIKSCNTVISLAGENPESDKIAGAGIAYAMRAMFYMDIARMFGMSTYGRDKSTTTVPIVKETTTLTELTNNPRATNEEMWAFIISDLDKAETYLADYKRLDIYTPDLSVVYGLKARAYLTMEDWANAEKYAKQAQNGYTAMTETQYTSRKDGFNTPNGAWMFACRFKDTDPNIQINDGDGSWGTHMILEVRESGMGYAANYGAPKRIDRHLYETIPATDFRKKCFIDFAIDQLPTDDAKVEALSAYSDVPNGILETGSETNSKVVGGLEVKFRPKDGEHKNQLAAYVVSVPMMRVEEMMLIEAEAVGMQDEARGKQLLTTFAKLRDPNYEYGKHLESYDSDYAKPFQNEVWWQRRVELWGEGFATFDIKRLNKKVIRAYANTNHADSFKWNSDVYTASNGSLYPDWMDLCIVQSEGNYNKALVNNKTPQKPTASSADYIW
ncbi:MAG: RagB/SusD family nutrient uptake outer membrane protein [Bacteroidales bacterium]|nr:RagB/SusD family nutrient uptake outer membrane protein [Bacteroidales bacterium]MDY6002092.1 RagB/SusD family nutrient uptake outer membrane protein [Candidatus Cryptobacteroides sp.]